MNTPRKRANYLTRLFRGDVPLVITYWVFGVLIGNVFLLGLANIVDSNRAWISLNVGTWLFISLFWLTFCYSIFVNVAIWRSALKYTGNAVWSSLAMVVVMVGFIILAYQAYAFSNRDSFSPAHIELSLQALNKSLPLMIDEDVRLDKANAEGFNILYNFTLLNSDTQNADQPDFREATFENLRQDSCHDDYIRNLLNFNYRLNFSYRDELQNQLFQIAITKNDCDSLTIEQ